MDENDERTIELSSIEAIYPELILDPTNPYKATLDLPVTPEKPLKIYFQSSTSTVPTGLLTPPTSEGTSSKEIVSVPIPAPLGNALKIDVHELAHLPPLKLNIVLPDGYPSSIPPSVTVRSDPDWLPESTLLAIQEKCTKLWKECGQDQVLFSFIDYIQQKAERAFDLTSGNSQDFQLPSDLKLVLLDYDLKRKRETFENETFDCGVCLEPKKGKVCHRILMCGHVFCIVCLQDFYNACITSGDIDNVKCLDPGCGKNLTVEVSPGRKRKIDPTLNPSELLQIPIEQQQVQRYVQLKRKRKLETDKNTVYCPRQWCQGAARSKKHPKLEDPLHDTADFEYESENEAKPALNGKGKKRMQRDIPMAERIAICEDCNFAFCSVCKKGWHGELVTNCDPRARAELDAEEKASMDYMKRHSTPCPTCNAPAQKAMGCNHMICFKCKTHFCYLCASFLMPDNPYKHFNDFKSPCYMRLWELEGGDGADVGIGYGGGNAAPWEAEVVAEPEDESSDEDEDEQEEGQDDAADGLDEADSDSDNEEPAPDQRRPDRPRPHIEIVNFAGNGAGRRIELPNQVVNRNAPLPAPAIPAQQGRRRRRRGNGGLQAQAQAHRNARAPLGAPLQQVAVVGVVEEPAPVAAVAAPGQGNNLDDAIQRFLQLAIEDREDEWDSDDDDDEDGDDIAIEQAIRGLVAHDRRR